MWINLKEKQKVQILEQLGAERGLPAFVIEKDWWVCILLKAVFQSKYADSIIFKGGTSLSKAYQLINRFSEDIDLIIDRKLLGFAELKSSSAIKRLRKASGGFIITEFKEELISQLRNLGIEDNLYEIKYNAHVDDTSDPNALEVYYKSVIPTSNSYIEQRVLLEMGARSLTEPAEMKPIISFIDQHYAHLPFAMPLFNVQVVIPTRTFIEKTLLLHEEFIKPLNKIRTDRLTRHLYDLEKIMDTAYGLAAVKDDKLFQVIVEHRKHVTPLRNLDYSKHEKGKLNIIPPNEVLKAWEADYKVMQEHMIVGESLNWDKLMERIMEIQNRFNHKNKLSS